MYARIPTFKVASNRIDAAIQEFKEVSLPKLHAFHGFKGATMLVDREKGMFRVVAFWEDRQALDASRDGTKPLREDIAQKLNGEIVSLEEWEVAVDYYPEMMAETTAAGAAHNW